MTKAIVELLGIGTNPGFPAWVVVLSAMIGAILGVLVICIVISGGRVDDRMDKFLRENRHD